MQETVGRKADRLGRRDRHFGSRHTGTAGVEGCRYDTRQTRIRAFPGGVQESAMERRKYSTTP